jgi:hypothetical protein
MQRPWSNVVVATVLGLVTTVASAAGRDDDFRRHHPRSHAEVRADRIRELYNDLVFPTPSLILAGQKSVDNIFDSSVRGRVTPVGHFHDEQAVNEYFFALASTPTSRVTQVTFQSLAASGTKVAVEVDIHFERTNAVAFTLRQTGFFTFNDRDHVVSFDLSILNLGAAVNPTSDAEREANIQGVCAVLTLGGGGHAATCPGEYVDFADCLSFMHSIPYGTWDRANSNTAVCRQLHTLLTPYRPDVHCPHAGKTGGGACIDFSYASFFDEEF